MLGVNTTDKNQQPDTIKLKPLDLARVSKFSFFKMDGARSPRMLSASFGKHIIYFSNLVEHVDDVDMRLAIENIIQACTRMSELYGMPGQTIVSKSLVSILEKLTSVMLELDGVLSTEKSDENSSKIQQYRLNVSEIAQTIDERSAVVKLQNRINEHFHQEYPELPSLLISYIEMVCSGKVPIGPISSIVKRFQNEELNDKEPLENEVVQELSLAIQAIHEVFVEYARNLKSVSTEALNGLAEYKPDDATLQSRSIYRYLRLMRCIIQIQGIESSSPEALKLQPVLVRALPRYQNEIRRYGAQANQVSDNDWDSLFLDKFFNVKRERTYNPGLVREDCQRVGDLINYLVKNQTAVKTNMGSSSLLRMFCPPKGKGSWATVKAMLGDEELLNTIQQGGESNDACKKALKARFLRYYTENLKPAHEDSKPVAF